MKWLGIDYGRKRIGLATSDASGTIASPLLTLENKGEKKNTEALLKIIADHNIEGIMCGMPQNIVGGDSGMSGEIKEFGRKLEEASGIGVEYVNERYSSKEAEEHIRVNLGITKWEKVKELVDKMVACMLLQEWLDKKKGER